MQGQNFHHQQEFSQGTNNSEEGMGQEADPGGELHLHCDWENIAGCCHSHAGGEHNLLAVAMQDTVIGVPGSWQGEGDVYFLVGFSAFERETETRRAGVWFTKVSEQQSLGEGEHTND